MRLLSRLCILFLVKLLPCSCDITVILFSDVWWNKHNLQRTVSLPISQPERSWTATARNASITKTVTSAGSKQLVDNYNYSSSSPLFIVVLLWSCTKQICIRNELQMTWDAECRDASGSNNAKNGGSNPRVTGHRSQVTGRGSQVAGRGSQVAGHRSQVIYKIIIYVNWLWFSRKIDFIIII